ncbi:hypothetical protein EYF80_064083 [Liparis tanakae]|uniref:Uncharacterized protein n=1 Tax=Liparis tanakae TaxID=230148 RepID=A0A4Z2EAK1_9TELE|nr:hypothetical protein EYF80_064083 [Liparis tanakae]
MEWRWGTDCNGQTQAVTSTSRHGYGSQVILETQGHRETKYLGTCSTTVLRPDSQDEVGSRDLSKGKHRNKTRP